MSGASDIGGAVSARGATGEGFAIGRALSRAFSVFGQGYVQFIALTAIVYVPLLLAVIFVARNPSLAGRGVLVTVCVQTVVSSLASAACLLGAYQVMRGRSFTIGGSLAGGLGRFWAVLGTSLLGGLLASLGMLLLIVPGFIVVCAIYVALPVCVIERLGPTTSLKRSQGLTKGYRWPIFGLLLIVGVASWLLGFGLGLVAAFIPSFVAAAVGGSFTQGALVGAVAQVVAEVLVGAFGSVLAAVVYHDLRADKEGVDIEQLASVFD